VALREVALTKLFRIQDTEARLAAAEESRQQLELKRNGWLQKKLSGWDKLEAIRNQTGRKCGSGRHRATTKRWTERAAQGRGENNSSGCLKQKLNQNV